LTLLPPPTLVVVISGKVWLPDFPSGLPRIAPSGNFFALSVLRISIPWPPQTAFALFPLPAIGVFLLFNLILLLFSRGSFPIVIELVFDFLFLAPTLIFTIEVHALGCSEYLLTASGSSCSEALLVLTPVFGLECS
jgi:hypothetical protein